MKTETSVSSKNEILHEMKDPTSSFNEHDVIHNLKHYLPTQAALRDFIHHNSLHAFQNLKFYDAIFKASKMFGYQVTLQLNEFRTLYKNGRIRKDVLEKVICDKKGLEQVEKWKVNLISKDYDCTNAPRVGVLRSNWKTQCKLDLDSLVQPLLFRILSNYLDQGISLWKFPVGNKSFLDSIKELEKNSYISFFKTKRAKQLLLSGDCQIKSLLKIVVGDEKYFEQYLFDQQFAHQGWSGITSAIEDMPQTLMDTKNITLRDLIIFELILEIDALDFNLPKNWQPLSNFVSTEPIDLFDKVPTNEINEVFTLWQNAFEWSYYDGVITGIALGKKQPQKNIPKKSFQALFCIDERECSIRRHTETSDANCETFGTPGFFTVEFYFMPDGGKFYDKLCPAPVTPKYLIKEFNAKEKRGHETLYSHLSHTFFIGYFVTLTLGFWAAVRLFLNLFKPAMSPAISNAFTHMDNDSQLLIENKNLKDRENGLQIGFTIEEMAARVESLLRSIGLLKDFAPIVYVIGHGSSSANNPHHGAHDCGACSGRPGSVNAKVFAFMANHNKVRQVLSAKGIVIPNETQFIGGLHDTAADQIKFYDTKILSEKNKEQHTKNAVAFENALDLNAKERSRRFASINTKLSLKKVREEIRKRSVSLFEPRPELGHGTNSLCIIAGRNLTKGLFLDRRAFLNSYNYETDPDGKILTGIMKPVGPVCGGINLEYYFSRVDNHKFGAGTKLPHNVVGLFGVANSSDGDLRPGLPVQMIEPHDPVRLLVVIEHFPEIVLKVIQFMPEMYEWYINEWIHLMVVNPETNKFYYFKEGQFAEYAPLPVQIDSLIDFNVLMDSALEMETNHIEDATHENLPVFILK